MPSPAVRTLGRSANTRNLFILHQPIKTYPSAHNPSTQSLRNHTSSNTYDHLSSASQLRRSSTNLYSYEMLATAGELGQMTGYPGVRAKISTSKASHKKNITDSDGNHFDSDIFAALSSRRIINDTDGNHFDPAILKIIWQELSCATYASTRSHASNFSDSSCVAHSSDLTSGSETVKPNFGAARDAEEAAKYYI